MKRLSSTLPAVDDEIVLANATAPPLLPAMIPEAAKAQLTRMFRDPYLLEDDERAELVQQLRDAVSFEPSVPELRVLLGMALCVNLDAQAALEELRESVRMAPDHFAARLKFGELLMRLRICSQAAEETQIAARLASNPVQAELARRQAATIRTMLREGIERGAYGRLLPVFGRIGRLFTRAEPNQAAVALNSR